MSSGGRGSWCTAWSLGGEPACPNAEPGLGIPMYKKKVPSQKGKIQNNFSLWRQRKEGGRERRQFLFQRLFKELICDTCTHFLTTGQNKDVDAVNKDLHQAQVTASQAGSPGTTAILRTPVGVSCTRSPVLQQAMHRHFTSFVPFHSLLWYQRSLLFQVPKWLVLFHQVWTPGDQNCPSLRSILPKRSTVPFESPCKQHFQ